jgi:hypothetical protein
LPRLIYISIKIGIQGFWWEYLRRGDHLGDPQHRWEDNFKMDLQKVGCGGMDWIELAQDGYVVGTCECDNEPSRSIKRGELID